MAIQFAAGNDAKPLPLWCLFDDGGGEITNLRGSLQQLLLYLCPQTAVNLSDSFSQRLQPYKSENSISVSTTTLHAKVRNLLIFLPGVCRIPRKVFIRRFRPFYQPKFRGHHFDFETLLALDLRPTHPPPHLPYFAPPLSTLPLSLGGVFWETSPLRLLPSHIDQ